MKSKREIILNTRGCNKPMDRKTASAIGALFDLAMKQYGKMKLEPVGSNASLDALARNVLKMCRRRGWSLHWTARGAYLHLESSELIEARRGKDKSRTVHVAVREEAADVLLVLMSITEEAGVPFFSVIQQAAERCGELMTKPRYAGEEFTKQTRRPKPADTRNSRRRRRRKVQR